MIEQIAQAARAASLITASLSTQTKNEALRAIGRALTDHQSAIVQANRSDLARAEEQGLNQALIKRLKFDEAKLADAVAGIESDHEFIKAQGFLTTVLLSDLQDKEDDDGEENPDEPSSTAKLRAAGRVIASLRALSLPVVSLSHGGHAQRLDPFPAVVVVS